MKLSNFLILVSILLVLPGAAQQIPVNSSIGYDAANPSNNIVLTWESVPTKFYHVLTTTALGQQPWLPLNPAPIYSPNNLVRFVDTNNQPARFYKVIKLDTDPPEIWRLNPGSNSFSVARQNALKISLRDETGIDPASLVLSVGTNAPVTLADLHVSYVDGTLTYTPATNEFHGANGETITATLAISDTLGHRTTNRWSFRLELATILADNVVLITNSGPLTFVSSNDNAYVFSYSGVSSGLTNGHVLVSTDPENDYKLVVLSITDNPAAHTVSLVATQALMSDIFTQGSFRFLAEDPGLDVGGFRPASETHSFTTNLSGKTIYDENGLSIKILSGQFFFDQDFSISAEISLSDLPKVDVDLSSTLGLDLELQATYQGTLSYSGDQRIGGPMRLVRFRGCIPTPIPLICIPFRADLVGEINIGFESEVTGTATVTGGFQSTMELKYGSRLRNRQWKPYHETILPEPVVSPVSWMATGSGRLRVYLEPKLTLYVWATRIGTGNLKPYLEMEANACVQPDRAGTVLTLYRGVSSTLALDLKKWEEDWGEQPSVELFNVRKQVWQKDLTTPIGGSTLPTPIPNMVWIPCGSFLMGSPPSEMGRTPNEGPQTRVTISRGFWMGRYEVTQAEYLEITGTNPSFFNGFQFLPGVFYGTDLNRPVEQIFWNHAVAYCDALTSRERQYGRLIEGYVYRLPTAAEWEYACRAGTVTAFHYGPTLQRGMANFGVGIAYYLRTNLMVTPVGSYAPNNWGLYDMHGNVAEWCLDWQGPNLPGGSVTDPQGPPTGADQVIKGGSWYDFYGYDCRAAALSLRSGPIFFPRGDRGFRVVLAPAIH